MASRTSASAARRGGAPAATSPGRCWPTRRSASCFLAKIKELLDTTYTQKAIFPLIESMGKRLEDEVKFRAELRKEDPKDAVKRLNKNSTRCANT